MAGVVMVGDLDRFGELPAAGSMGLAKPKSSTFTVPSSRRRTTRSEGDTSAGTRDQSTSARSTAAIVSETSSPSNARTPVTVS